MKLEDQIAAGVIHRDPMDGLPGGSASLDDGDPTYIQAEPAMPITGIVETPPVKPGIGLVRF